MAKASMEELNSLHDMVAKTLAKDLDDPKTLALAIKFLKDNAITVDVMESETTQDLFSKVEALKRRPDDGDEDLLADYMS